MMNGTHFIVEARSDGRGGFYPFGTYGAKQAGAMVQIGDKSYKVTTDGRVNIPKSIMDRYGAINDKGRRVIHIAFKTNAARNPKDTWRNVQAAVQTPTPADVNKKTGSKPTKATENPDEQLLPGDGKDSYWSALV